MFCFLLFEFSKLFVYILSIIHFLFVMFDVLVLSLFVVCCFYFLLYCICFRSVLCSIVNAYLFVYFFLLVIVLGFSFVLFESFDYVCYELRMWCFVLFCGLFCFVFVMYMFYWFCLIGTYRFVWYGCFVFMYVLFCDFLFCRVFILNYFWYDFNFILFSFCV